VVAKKGHKELARHILLAYCGKPHASKDINGRWVKQFLRGVNRNLWMDVIASTREFVKALAGKNYHKASGHMNRETGIRRKMTPDVLDKVGRGLAGIALQNDCGVRFTGAGGGGCLWALGEVENIDRLRPLWQKSLSSRKEACLLDVGIDSKGVIVD
jgi:D-glycero-alpha-D-manno-heptose-7-phosphate kinase